MTSYTPAPHTAGESASLPRAVRTPRAADPTKAAARVTGLPRGHAGRNAVQHNAASVDRCDLAITGATVVTPEGARPATVLVSDGQVSAIVPPATAVNAPRRIDATGLHLIPGVIDLHVHFDVPGISLTDDFHTGTRSAAAGGVTFVVEHPFSDPPTTTAARYEAKTRQAATGAVVDFGLWGALTRPSLDEMAGQHRLGAPGFKAFLPENDMDFPPATETDLLTGMTTAARLGARVLVHAEDRDALAHGEAALRAAGRTDFAALLEARPPATEINAVREVLRLARSTGCAVHLVHLSTPEAIDLVTEARAEGLDATCEVTAHHLLLTASELPHLGGFGVCAPPLRDAHQVEELWDRVRSGQVHAIVSDHCPYDRADKLIADEDVFGCPFGIQSVQEYAPLVISEAIARGMALTEIVPLMTSGPARLVGAQTTKGAVAVGLDADFALLDLDAPWVVSAAEQQHAADQWSPYDGRTSMVKVVRTVVRGVTVALDGEVIAAKGTGRFLPLAGPVAPAPASNEEAR
ncbi:allantoinase AllB [Streptomyces sp. NBC_00690]|uniref:allantoinase AllB n=1 Tax=Streptomyces sp. NBC_00690 TaxID=2975808 RepID=UPI002E282DEF|nr:allantoinase AllB [Streptomyces sp. NBC_00690]